MSGFQKKKCEICGAKTCRMDGQKRIFMARFPLDEDRMQTAIDLTSKWLGEDTGMEDNKDAQIIKQFVHNVEDFSSGSYAVVFTKLDICGPLAAYNFPDYGDHNLKASFMRTMGPWWDETPSFLEDYTPLNSGRIQSHDFVEVSFKRAVCPLEVAVFETFNPGALVRIWALVVEQPRMLGSWVLLWEGKPENVGHTPRIFSPPIREVDFTTRTLRLEFNHKLLPYSTELGAVLLKGKLTNYSYPIFTRSEPAIEKDVLLKQVMASNLHENVVEPSNLMPKDVKVDTGPPLGDFHRLPDEMILSVFKYLDMQSLCRCAQVNKHFRRIACDAILYRCIDLRPYWHCLRSEVLLTLSMKCKFLQKLDLSWCGSYSMINSDFFVNFLRQSGANLTHLRMNCCKFVNNSVLKAIGDTLSNLQELCLGLVKNCLEWSYLASLTKLKRLYLYRTSIRTSEAVAVVRSNPGLQHLNLGYCNRYMLAQVSLDEVAIALGSNCPDLMSVDFSGPPFLTAAGFRALENCKKLQEVRLGWCSCGFMQHHELQSAAGDAEGQPRRRIQRRLDRRHVCLCYDDKPF